MYRITIISGRLTLAVLAAALAACSELMPAAPDSALASTPPARQYQTTDLAVRVAVPTLTPAPVATRSVHAAGPAAAVVMPGAAADRIDLRHEPQRYAPGRLASAVGSHADVKSVTITAAGNDANGVRQDPLATAELTESEGSWVGTLAGITLGTPISFTAVAKDDGDNVLFRGTHSATLTRQTAALTIKLSAVSGAGAGQFPVVSAIVVETIRAQGSGNVTVSVTGKKAETLKYEFKNGTFLPSSGSVTTDSPQSGATGTATITSKYTAPEAKGGYTAQVVVTNSAGNRVAVDFRIAVDDPARLAANLGPAVLSVAGRRIPAGVQWTANVSSAGEAAVTYSWSFTSAPNTPVAGTSFSSATTNPALLTGYDQTKTGTLKVTATQGTLSSSASFQVPANLFPNALQLPVELVINEIDYDTPGTGDTAEFVEILNPGASAVDLSGYRVELVDGSGGEAYATYTGSGQLGAGKYFVIGDTAVIQPDPPFPVGTITLALDSKGLQQGPDIVRIVKISTEKVMDAVQYEGRASGAGEGASAPSDTDVKSIGRCPNGSDTNDNGADFVTMTPTPGKTNTCS